MRKVGPMCDTVTGPKVLAEGYGGELLDRGSPQTEGNNLNAAKKSTNACMLVYIRKVMIDQVLIPVTEEDAPLHLSRPVGLVSS